MARVLITGGAGYIGSVLSQRLLEIGHDVRVLDNLSFGGEPIAHLLSHPHFDFVRGDIREPGDRARALRNIDQVVNLAAIVGEPASLGRPAETMEINHEAAVALAKDARLLGIIRFIQASTCSNYGVADFANEETELKPLSPYAISKVKAETAILELAQGPFAPCILRFATVFGLSPRMRFDLLVNELARDAAKSGVIQLYGADACRPYVHVDDVASAIATCLIHGVKGCTFNVGSNAQNAKKSEIGEKLRGFVHGLQVNWVDGQTDARDYRVDFSRIEKTILWRAKRPIESGMREIILAIRDGVIADPHAMRYRNA